MVLPEEKMNKINESLNTILDKPYIFVISVLEEEKEDGSLIIWNGAHIEKLDTKKDSYLKIMSMVKSTEGALIRFLNDILTPKKVEK